MLSEIQRAVLESVTISTRNSDFALAGGGALIVHGLVSRSTRDLDFFTTRASEIQEFVPRVETRLRELGFNVRPIQNSERFVRIEVSRSNQVIEVDFGVDARLFPDTRETGSPILTTKELAVDKVLAIFGRAEARDFEDLAALTRYSSLEELFALAAKKDTGFRVEVFAKMSRRINSLGVDEFSRTGSDLDALREEVKDWQRIAQSYGQSREPDFGLER